MEGGLYTWEKKHERSWETLEEDEQGQLNQLPTQHKVQEEEEPESLVRRGNSFCIPDHPIHP